MSWHHGDWLTFAQAVASVAAVIGAFGVVIFQHRLHTKHSEQVAARDRLRERYRASTYAEALIQNAISCFPPIIRGIEFFAEIADENQNKALDASTLDTASSALAQAIHNGLPSEITICVLSAWSAAQQASHALHRTEVVTTMKMSVLKSYCDERLLILNQSLEDVQSSKAKWDQRLNKN